jgi:hypothetical protein
MSEPLVSLDDEIEKLRTIAADTDDPRSSALLLAVTDNRVREALTERIAGGHEYAGALATFQAGTVDVVFVFARRPGQFGLVPLSILATVEPAQQRVQRVVEHYYLTDTRGRPQPGALQPQLDLSRFLVDQEGLLLVRPEPVGANGPTYWC